MRRLPPFAAVRLTLTPLIDVAFLVLIFFMALPLRQLDTKLAAHLPRNVGHDETRSDPEAIVRIRVRQRLDTVAYELGDRRYAAATGMAPVLRLLGAERVYEIHSDPEVEWQAVVSVMDLLNALAFRQVRFRGSRIPPDARRAPALPRPA